MNRNEAFELVIIAYRPCKGGAFEMDCRVFFVSRKLSRKSSSRGATSVAQIRIAVFFMIGELWFINFIFWAKLLPCKGRGNDICQFFY
jgi:hypothetical protein